MDKQAHRWTSVDGRLGLARVNVPRPARGEVTIDVRAAGVNPIDVIDLSNGAVEIGYEVSGTVSALGPQNGEFQIGDPVVAFRIRGGYATALTASVRNVLAKPPALEWAAAANLLLAGTAAKEMLYRVAVSAGDVVLIHGASGAVGISAVQQARLVGARVIGTAAAHNFDLLRTFGAEPVAYGRGLQERVRAIASRVDAAIDAAGTDEAIDASLALVKDARRIASSAAFARGSRDGFWLVGREPDSARYRDAVRQHLIDLAARGQLVVPVVRTYAFADAASALESVASGHAGGKLALSVP